MKRLPKRLRPTHKIIEYYPLPLACYHHILRPIFSSFFYLVHHVWLQRKKLQDILKGKTEFEEIEQATELDSDITGMLQLSDLAF